MCINPLQNNAQWDDGTEKAPVNAETVKMNGDDKHHGNTAAMLVVCVTLRKVRVSDCERL